MTIQVEEYSHFADIEGPESPEALNRKKSSILHPLNKYIDFRNKRNDRKFSTSQTSIKYFKQRTAIYKFLQNGEGLIGRAYHIFVSCLILFCVLLTILCTFTELPYILNVVLYAIDVFILFIFISEFLVRLWSSSCVSHYRGWRGKMRFFRSPFRIIDIGVIITSILIISFNLKSGFLTPSLKGIRFFQTFKMVRLEHRFRPWRVMGSVIWAQREHLYITSYTCFLALLFTSFLIYYLEKDSNPMFSNLGQSLWWTVISLCTIGYGDIYPITTAGKVLSSICCILGVSLFALPAGILGTGLALKVQEQQRLRQRGKRRIPAAQLIQAVWRCHAFNKHPTYLSNSPVHTVSHSTPKLRNSHKKNFTENEMILIKFILKVKYFVSRKRFTQALKPYDVKDVLEQYSAGHQEMLSRVKTINCKITQIESTTHNSLRGHHELKSVLNYRLTKIEDYLKDTETKLDSLMKIQIENKILYENILTFFETSNQCLANNEINA